MRKCIFAGTFDPPTVAHKKVVETARKLFDEVVVALLINPDKTPLFSKAERLEMMEMTFENAKVLAFDGTVDELLKRENTPFYVRGIRNAKDFDYEQENMLALKKLDASVIPVFLPCEQDFLHVSSSFVRECIKYKKDYSDYVDKKVKEYIETKKK